jgi:3-hydroxyacyl-CoA dehydrogenase
MTLKIRRACVLGAGVMGAQIAAHLAAAGVRTHLLDLSSNEPPSDPKLKKAVGKNFRSTRAILAIEQMKSMKPSPLMSPAVLVNLLPGNFDDDMSIIAQCDWVIEAVVERMDIKEKIHKLVSEVAPNDVPITTNTSGISVTDMAKHFPEHLARNFFGTHFFNPPRYLHLVEIVPHGAADQKLMSNLGNWISERLGKGIVQTNDTTNFIANRIGVYNLQVTIKHMDAMGLNIETVDALTGKLMGRPSSATFRTLDVVGLDTYAHTTKNVLDRAKGDPFIDDFRASSWVMRLIEKGQLGQKTGSVGCYKKSKNGKGATEILVYRPVSETYEAQSPAAPAWLADAMKLSSPIDRMILVFTQTDAHAQFVWKVLRDTLNYSASCLEEIANGNPKSVDDAIRWGFSWEFGPFELWQGMGYDLVRERMIKEGVKIPAWCKEGVKFYRPVPGSEEWLVRGPDYVLESTSGRSRALEKPRHLLNLPKFQSNADDRIVDSCTSASLVDLGDGVTCLTFHSKMNTLNDELILFVQKSIERARKDFDAMVIGNDAVNFSAGADLRNFVKLIDSKDWKGIDEMLRVFQGTMQMIKFAPFPTVSAPRGLTLGGGCEVSLHTSDQVLAGETYAGLVEIGVGVLPAGGGTKELALRAYKLAALGEKADPMAFLQRAFQLIGMAKVSSSGIEAVEMGLYPQRATICLSDEHQILKAKEVALHLARMGYVPPSPVENLTVVGDPGVQTIKIGLYNMKEAGFITEYEYYIGERIAAILCGGRVDGGQTVSEQYLLDLERAGFVDLCKQPKTRERIEHMLKTGKVLRN